MKRFYRKTCQIFELYSPIIEIYIDFLFRNHLTVRRANFYLAGVFTMVNYVLITFDPFGLSIKDLKSS